MTKAKEKVWVWMDISATCNLACRDCYTKHTHKPSLITPENFRLILNKLGSAGIAIQKLHLNWRGEPLTNKNLPELLHATKEILPKVPLEFHTNGLLLTKEKSTALLEHLNPTDLVYVSIDGGNAQAHEANRGKNTWRPTLQGLNYLLDARDKLNHPPPQISIYEISYRTGISADPELIRLSKRCNDWIKVYKIFKDGSEISFTNDDNVPFGPCFWAGNAFCITTVGDVHVCLLSFRPDGRLGNLFGDDVTTILERAKRYRSLLIEKGRKRINHCAECRKCEGQPDG